MTLSPGTRLGPYEIEGELGRGGMGEVYRALDTRLGREVAIKILPQAFSMDPESVRRFEKEARAVASLSHPNIVTLLDVGEQEGVRYAVAELVAGETLRTRLAAGSIPAKEASEIAAQIADGLAAAHEKGVVHRDVKPENVVITPSGFARILDFGLSKRSGALGSAAEDEDTRSELLTEPGVVAGTVGYMSPEQVRGEPVDGRSDVFSLGVVLWEMLTGRRPFRGDSQIETLNAILKEEPPPDPAVATLPPNLERILRRCLEKRRESRYHSAADLAHDLRATSSAASLPAVSAVTAVVPDRRKPLPWALGLAGLAALALLALFVLRPRLQRSPALPRTLAVLPLRAIGSETTGEHFGLGLADSVIGRLAAVKELTVRPTSAIARYESAPAAAADVGRSLGVEAVLEGTYQRVEGSTRVSVQMTDVSREALLWSDRIDVPAGRLFELQDAISRRIVERLELQLDARAKKGLEKSQPVPDRVMEAYLEARAHLPEVAGADLPHRVEIVAAFDRILADQPTFARAIGARSYARAWLTFVNPTTENYEAALADGERAVALDPDLVEPRLARASLAWSSLGGWDVVKALQELKGATSRAPNFEIAHLDLARIAYHSGWIDDARREVEEALRLNPSGEGRRISGAMSTWLESPRRGLEKFRSLPPEMQSNWVTRWHILWIRATLEDALKVLPDAEALDRENPFDPISPAVLAVVRARMGQPTADLEQRIAKADRRLGHFHHVLQFLADVRAIGNDAPGSVELLREASKTGFPCAPCFDNDPLLAPVRSSKEYAELKKEIERRNAGYRAALKGVL